MSCAEMPSFHLEPNETLEMKQDVVPNGTETV